MKSTEAFGEYLQQLIDRHHKDLSILLEDYGIQEEPTPKILMAMMKLNGPEFVAHLANLPEDRADGNFLNTLSKGFELITKGKEAAQVFKGGTDTQSEAAPLPAPKPKVSKKKIIGLTVGVIVVLIIITVIVKKVRKK